MTHVQTQTLPHTQARQRHSDTHTQALTEAQAQTQAQTQTQTLTQAHTEKHADRHSQANVNTDCTIHFGSAKSMHSLDYTAPFPLKSELPIT